MEVSCHLYALVAYPWGKKFALLVEWEALWAQEAVWTHYKRDTALSPTENRTTMIYVLQITNHAPNHRPGRRRESLSAYIIAYELHFFFSKSVVL
jgi:hypothetical protein